MPERDLFGAASMAAPPPDRAGGSVVGQLVALGFDGAQVRLWTRSKAHAVLARSLRAARARQWTREVAWELSPEREAVEAEPGPVGPPEVDADWLRGVAGDPPECEDELRRVLSAATESLPYWAVYRLVRLAERLHSRRMRRRYAELSRRQWGEGPDGETDWPEHWREPAEGVPRAPR